MEMTGQTNAIIRLAPTWRAHTHTHTNTHTYESMCVQKSHPHNTLVMLYTGDMLVAMEMWSWYYPSPSLGWTKP